MAAERFLPLDVATMSPPGRESCAEERGWVTPYPAYRFISYEMVTAVCDAASSFHDRGDSRIITGAKLYEILCDLQRIVRIALDLHGIREAGAKLRFSADSSRILAFLTDPELSPAYFFDPYWPASRAGGLRPIARDLYWSGRCLAGIVAQRSRADLMSRNDLLSEYLEIRRMAWVSLPLPRHLLAPPGSSSRSVDEITEVLFAALRTTLPPELSGGTTIAERVALAAKSCISRHLAEAERELRRLRRTLSWRSKGAMLVSGTPKWHGRLLAALYAGAGRRVIRFAHGGERGLYADLHWPIPELTFCDEYYLHGRGEADLIAARAANGAMLRVDHVDMRFESLGSRKHQAILQRVEERPAKSRIGRVMYVPHSYLGEISAHFPAMCPPDPVYYEWQSWLLAQLKNLGYDVVVKAHPKGINNDGSLLAGLCSEIVLGHFDPNAHDVDCYLFDFAGTAFMDALASGTGVVLLDHGVRPLDPAGAKLLDGRVERVPCHFDELNRFRIGPDLLAQAIETAIAAPSLDRAATFVNCYFSD